METENLTYEERELQDLIRGNQGIKDRFGCGVYYDMNFRPTAGEKTIDEIMEETEEESIEIKCNSVTHEFPMDLDRIHPLTQEDSGPSVDHMHLSTRDLDKLIAILVDIRNGRKD